MGRTRRKSKSSNWLLLFAVALIGGTVFLLQRNSSEANTNLNPQDIPQAVSTSSDYWAGTDFNYRRKLNITSKASSIMSYTFDHASLVKDHQSLPDGSDLKVVAQIDTATEVLPVELNSVNTASTKLKFDTTKYPQATYYLYFGNKQPDAPKVLGASATTGKPEVQITAESIETPLLDVRMSNYWQLNYKDGVKLKVDLNLQAALEAEKTTLYYVVDSSEKYQPLNKLTAAKANLELNLGNLKNGSHSVYLIAVSQGKTYRSASLKFKVSKPLFIAWSIDWEGYDVKDTVLESFTNISKKYHIPMTHFFNPRIYIDPTIAPYRRNQLTNWVKSRQSQNGDEIAMHMHMQYDMVREAGVNPISSPRWGTGKDGYDVLTSDYNFDQITQILRWGLQTFAAQGLPVPKGFRAGGWFASLDTLKAENALGFVYDSSGRESYTFGAKNAKGPWTLSHTTQPYRPSTINQNSSEPAPNFDLWEMPNNGNDSYWFNTQDLIDRFYANYTTPGKEVDTTRLVTYLSHPDWFYVDQPKIEALFAEVSKYSYAEDKGPVVFVTMSDALSQWQK
jgi:predicted deacetylase